MMVLFTASVAVALDSISFGVVASEGDAMVVPATIPEKNNRHARRLTFMLMILVPVKWLLSLVFASYLKRSRDAASVKEASIWRKEREVPGES
jgi:hypothetical protein